MLRDQLQRTKVDLARYARSIWFWWIVTTIAYVGMNLFGHPSEGAATPLGYFAAAIGLFVPYGIASLPLTLVSPLSWVSIVVFFVCGAILNVRIREKHLPIGRHILLVLLLLAILTILVDIIRGTPFESYVILMNGAFPHYCC